MGISSLAAWSIAKTYSDGRREIERLDQQARIYACKRKLKSIDDEIESLQKLNPLSLLVIYKLNRIHESLRFELKRMMLDAKRQDDFDDAIKNHEEKICISLRAQMDRRMEVFYAEMGIAT